MNYMKKIYIDVTLKSKILMIFSAGMDKTKVLLSLILCGAITACSLPVYMPEHLSNTPTNKLARIGMTGGIKEVRCILAIDGVETPEGPDVYVIPGKHEIKYNLPYDEKYNTVITYAGDKEISRKYVGNKIIHHDNYGTCTLMFEAGNTYGVRRLHTMLNNCK
jgi:hypothetical protein